MRLLATARQELVIVITADMVAQFRLFVALGQPPYCADPTQGDVILAGPSEPVPINGSDSEAR
jgi:hypothetical protein